MDSADVPALHQRALELADVPHVAAQRQSFGRSSRIVINAADGGLGDSFLQLRPAFIAARRHPEKSFAIIVHPSLKTFEADLDKPANVRLTPHFDSASLEQSDVFVVNYAVGCPAEMTWMNWAARYGLSIAPDATRATLVRMARMQRVASASLLVRSAGSAEGRNLTDCMTALQNTLLGISVGERDLQRPVLTSRANGERRWDVLIAPDALTFRTSAGDRSRKSLSVEHWREVFALLPSELRIGIVNGTAHPRYCAEVVRVAGDILPHASAVDVDLRGLIEVLSQTAVYVGSDTATTHMAADHAARSELTVRLLFNEAAARLTIYAIRGLGERGAILSLARQRPPLHTPGRDPSDLSAIPAAVVAAFVSTGNIPCH
jgi:hypothetical protein